MNDGDTCVFALSRRYIFGRGRPACRGVEAGGTHECVLVIRAGGQLRLVAPGEDH